eukprot:jgi/Psemu1/179049/e_gw1.7.10.1
MPLILPTTPTSKCLASCATLWSDTFSKPPPRSISPRLTFTTSSRPPIPWSHGPTLPAVPIWLAPTPTPSKPRHFQHMAPPPIPSTILSIPSNPLPLIPVPMPHLTAVPATGASFLPASTPTASPANIPPTQLPYCLPP